MTIPPLREGQPLIWTGDFAEVVLSVERIAGSNIYRVQSTQGCVLPAWSNSYPAEHLAREAAGRAAHAFKTHGTAEGIEKYRNELAAQYWQQDARRLHRMHNQPLMDSLNNQLEAIRDLGTLAGTADLYAA